MHDKRPHLLFLVTEDWFFCSHFLDRAVAARTAGYRVSVATRVDRHGERITAHGLGLIPLRLERRGINPLRELRAVAELLRIYRSSKPDIVHHVALKPILYGTLAAKMAGVPHIVNAPVGMGYAFSSRRLLARLLRPAIILAYRWLMNPGNSCVVFENPDDRQWLSQLGIVDAGRTRLIRGAGVNLDLFAATGEPAGNPVVVLPARMLWDKGIGEFVAAAAMLRQSGVAARFVLAGERDAGNLAAIPLAQLERWHAEGIVEWIGHQDDMPRVLASAHIVCLPSYREGLPKALIEAAAGGRPIVTCDVPGCREVVRDEENGLLVPPHDVAGLAAALRRLIEQPALRARMGRRGRAIAAAEFSVQQVNSETLALYQTLLS
ncbi:MAG: glycosyltransferase family 4 protein [Sterolibacterium sp.]